MVLFRCVVLVADCFVPLRILNPKPTWRIMGLIVSMVMISTLFGAISNIYIYIYSYPTNNPSY